MARASLHPERGSPNDPGPAPERPPHRTSRAVPHVGSPGVVVGVDVIGALSLGAEADAVLLLEPGIGDFIYPGTTIFRVDERGTAVEDARLHDLVLVDRERTFEQDPAFGFRLLVDMANAALSPAVNDPTTAVQVLDELSDLLRTIADRRLRGSVSDDEGTPRLYYLAPSWEDYLGLACDEIRHYGADQPQIARRMKAMGGRGCTCGSWIVTSIIHRLRNWDLSPKLCAASWIPAGVLRSRSMTNFIRPSSVCENAPNFDRIISSVVP